MKQLFAAFLILTSTTAVSLASEETTIQNGSVNELTVRESDQTSPGYNSSNKLCNNIPGNAISTDELLTAEAIRAINRHECPFFLNMLDSDFRSQTVI